MMLKSSFARVADTLRLDAMTTAQAPGAWMPGLHPYARAHGIKMMRSQDGAWGVVSTRIRPGLLAEMFVSRMAGFAGVPVAPVFAMAAANEDDMAFPKQISVVPFERMISGQGLPFARGHAYLTHYASTLPFFQWLGDDMDRVGRNLCASPDAQTFCEFDFDNTDLANVFRIASVEREALPPEQQMLQDYAYRVHIDNKAITDFPAMMARHLPLWREGFAQGMDRLLAMPADAIDRTLAVMRTMLPVSAGQEKALRFYLDTRMEQLVFYWHCERWTGQMCRALPMANPAMTGSPKVYQFI